MARIIAVANQKGGVGKTTTAVNLAACLAAAEQSTLLVDCDSQANATAAIGFQKDPARRTLYNLLILNEPFDRIAQKSQVEGLDVVPADKNLAGAAVELSLQAGGSPTFNLLYSGATDHQGVALPVQLSEFLVAGLPLEGEADAFQDQEK